ncbi:MAG: IS21 family transposase [Candidatus Obscuribacterales bacterium]|nr:IS21 family transposase [Candidatus Obscuribacterales bacterium]
MRRIREVLRLVLDCKLSNRKTGESLGIGRSTVDEYVRRACAAGLTWPLSADLDDAGLEALLFPPAAPSSIMRPEPDFVWMHEQLKQPGVNLSLLWHEYRERHPDGYQYSAFCGHYRTWLAQHTLSMRQVHRAGDKMFSDFAGTKIPVVDPTTGEVQYAHLFVTALGASGFGFGKAFWSEGTESWCAGHIDAFGYFEGAPQLIVPDNPKAAVIKASPYEPELNSSFQQMAAHYGCAVMPARVRKPKDKPKAESTVRLYTTWVIARLRHRTFFSLRELNDAILEMVDMANNKPFKKQPGSRRDLFERLDKPALKPLPLDRWEFAELRRARVDVSYHVDVDGRSYSVPHQLARKEVELRLTARTVEVLFKGHRVASHARCLIPEPATLQEHMPPHHRWYAEWSPSRFLSWAANIGVATTQLIEKHLASANHIEISYRRCIGILKLAKAYGSDRLESASQRALATGAMSYSNIKSMLKTGIDRRPLPADQLPTHLHILHENIRGASYYVNEENQHAHSTNDREPENAQALRYDPSPGISDAGA